MYYDFLVKIPENTGKISKNKRGKTTYIEYTYGRKYIPDKKYNIPQRTTIGKMSDEDSAMMYPNLNFEKFFPEVSLPECNPSARSSCIKVGAFLVIKKIIEDYGLFGMNGEKDYYLILQPILLFRKTMQLSTILNMLIIIHH